MEAFFLIFLIIFAFATMINVAIAHVRWSTHATFSSSSSIAIGFGYCEDSGAESLGDPIDTPGCPK